MLAVNYKIQFINVNFVKFLKDYRDSNTETIFFDWLEIIYGVTDMCSSLKVKEISILYLDRVNVDLHN